MEPPNPDTEQLLDRAASGDLQAKDQLFERHRARLRHMVAIRFDSRLTSRLDPSDVVQETLTIAARQLPKYLAERPLPFYPWLRRLAWQRMVQLREHHVDAQRRSVSREAVSRTDLTDDSITELADRLVDLKSSPSAHVMRAEQRRRLHDALERLPDRDCELLVVRFLEQLSTSEIAVELGISEAAVKMRQLRALERLQRILRELEEGQP